MTTLATRSFETGRQAFAAAVQARSADLVDFSPGSILGAVADAETANNLWLQALIIQLLAVTRLASSFGTDVDSFVNQFGFYRIGAVAATTPVTFSRNTISTTAPLIPIGALAKTTDGSQIFSVYADPTNAAYSATLGGYAMASGVGSVTVPVQAVTPGSAGNVAAGTISKPASAITGVDTVTNPAAATGGSDAESDVAVKLRFIAFIASLSRATEGALIYAIQSIETGLQVAIHEQIAPNGATDYGMVTIYVDDGSGAPPPALITAANNAVGAYRAAGVRAGVYGATTLLATAAMTITTAAGYVHATVVGQVGAALAAAINALGLENTLPFTLLASIAYGVPGVVNVGSILLNGGTIDLVPGRGQTIKAASPVVA